MNGHFHSKVTSPTVEQQLQASGVAVVIVVLAQPGAGAGAAKTPGAVTKSVTRHFMHSEHSHIAALVRSSSLSRGTSLRRPVRPATQLYPNLGIMLGTVDRDGLAGLQADEHVTAISGTPQISLIRPERVASATLADATTWGIDFLGISALWQQGLSGKDVKIGHLDTGADGTHPALKNAIVGFADFEPALGRRVTPDPAPYDSGEHGTHTAATIAGRPVRGRRIGVAYAASLYSGVVIEGGNLVARVLGGLDWAVGIGVRIVSLSLGFRGWWQDFIPIVGILDRLGILPVIAIGNEGPGTSRSPGNYPTALSVGAVDSAGMVPNFSSSQTFSRADDPIVPDLVAPGVDVISAQPGNRYQSMDGTSMATPHVAGLAALLWEAKPTATAHEIAQAIFASCQLSKSMTSDRGNRGVPVAAAALTMLTGVKPPAATQVAVPGRKRRAASTRRAVRVTKRTRPSKRT